MLLADRPASHPGTRMRTVAATRSAGTEPASQQASKHSSAGEWCPQRVALCSALQSYSADTKSTERSARESLHSERPLPGYQTHGRTTTERAVRQTYRWLLLLTLPPPYAAALRCQQKFVRDGVRQNSVLAGK
jgi:hypothetical protein